MIFAFQFWCFLNEFQSFQITFWIKILFKYQMFFKFKLKIAIHLCLYVTFNFKEI